MTERTEDIQLNLLEKAKRYQRQFQTNKTAYQAVRPERYLNAWSKDSIGYLKLQGLQKAKWTNIPYWTERLKNIFRLGYQETIEVRLPSAMPQNPQIIVSWCTQNDFLDDGSFQCKYFATNSENLAHTTWVLISLDNTAPLALKENIVLFSQVKGPYSLRSLIKNALYCLKKNIPLCRESLSAHELASAFVNTLDPKTIEKLLLPYEAQPWQHALCNQVRQQQNVLIIGDLHSCLAPFPSDFIKRHAAPDKVIMHGQGQKDILVRHLEWNEEDVIVSPSRRFSSENHQHLMNKILLPYQFEDTPSILHALESLFQNHSINTAALHIRNHPARHSSVKHTDLINRISTLQKKYSKTIDQTQDDKTSIVIGASSAIIEALAHGFKVFQIAEDPIFDSYGSLIWNNIKTNHLSKNIILYEADNNFNYLEFGPNDPKTLFEYD